MKTQKIFLLVLVLLLSLGLVLVLASCDKTKKTPAPDCFVFGEQGGFDDSVELEGSVLTYNEEYNLVALETTELDDDGYATRTVKIIDVANGNRVLLTDEEAVYPGNNRTKVREYDLSSYPIIKVKSYSHLGDNEYGNPTFENSVSYYLIDKDNEAEALLSDVTGGDSNFEVAEINNIYLVVLEEKVYWINKDLEVLRTVLLDISDSYIDVGSGYIEQYFGFDAECRDYLYTYNFNPDEMSTTIIVYNPDGIASAQYNFANGVAYIDGADSIVNPKMYVLNNGNVLIQECVLVEEDEDYDFVFGAMGQKVALSTKIMDHVSGEVREVEFDYVIKSLESAYGRDEDGDFYFGLADGYDNQAYLIPVTDGRLGRVTEYTVLSNSLERKYTLKNSYLANYDKYDSIDNASADGYFAEAYVNGCEGVYKFDWEGNIIASMPTNDYTQVLDCYVTDSGVYRVGGSLVFDIEAFDPDNVIVEGDCVYLVKNTYETNVRDNNGHIVDSRSYKLTYKLNLSSGEAILVADEREEQELFATCSDGAYAVYDEKREIVTVYNKSGTAVLILREYDVVGWFELDGAIVIMASIWGEDRTYVLTKGDTALNAY